MRNFFLAGILLLVVLSCADYDLNNEALCIPVPCGEPQSGQVNFVLYNATGVDFDEFYFDIGGKSDTVGFLPLQQYTCWYNFDSLNTSYFIAQGSSDGISYISDTLWMNEDSQKYYVGTFLLEVHREDDDDDDDDDHSTELEFFFSDEYQGECTGL